MVCTVQELRERKAPSHFTLLSPSSLTLHIDKERRNNLIIAEGGEDEARLWSLE